MRWRGWTTGLVAMLVAGCGEPETSPPRPAPAPPAASIAEVTPSESAMAKWSRNCALCHINGEGGAPRLGDLEQWQARRAQGFDVLVQHTIDGYNNMPPLGYCMSCERDDFEQLVMFLAGNS